MGLLDFFRVDPDNQKQQWADVPFGLRLMAMGEGFSGGNMAPYAAAMQQAGQSAANRRRLAPVAARYAQKLSDPFAREQLLANPELVEQYITSDREREQKRADTMWEDNYKTEQFNKQMAGLFPGLGSAGTVTAGGGGGGGGGAPAQQQPASDAAPAPPVAPTIAGLENPTPGELAEIQLAMASRDPAKVQATIESLQKRRQTEQSQAATVEQNVVTRGQALGDDYTKAMEPLNKISNAAETAEALLQNGASPTEQIQMLYTLVTALDPASAVKEGEVALAQSIVSLQEQFKLAFQRVNSGDILPQAAVADMANVIGQLGNMARERRAKKSMEFVGFSKARGVPTDMFMPGDAAGRGLGLVPGGSGEVNDRYITDRPIRTGAEPAPGTTEQPDEEDELVRQFGG